MGAARHSGKLLILLFIVLHLSGCQTYLDKATISGDGRFGSVILQKSGRLPKSAWIFETNPGRSFSIVPLDTPLTDECLPFCNVGSREGPVANLPTNDYFGATTRCLDDIFPSQAWDFKRTYGSPEHGGLALFVDVKGSSKGLALKDESRFEMHRIWVRYIRYDDKPNVMIAQVELTNSRVANWSAPFFAVRTMPDDIRFQRPNQDTDSAFENYEQEIVNKLAVCVGSLQTAAKN